jgi:hypothetical protein
VKRETSTILLVTIITVVIGVASYTQTANACIDAKFIWKPSTYPPVFSVGDTVTFNASTSTLNWNSTTQEYIPLASVKWNFGDGTTEDYYGNATLSPPPGNDSQNWALWTWTFRDGNISEGMVVTHIFTQPGTYDVNLTITDEGGAGKWFRVPFTVEEASPVNEGASNGFPWWIAAVVVAAGIGIALPIYFKKVRKPK